MRIKSIVKASLICEAEDECSISRKVQISVDLDNGLCIDLYIPERELAKMLLSGDSIRCETSINNKGALSL